MPSLRSGVLLLTLFAMAACGQLGGVAPLPFLQSSAPSELRLLDGAFVAQGPTGFCVDPRSSNPRTGFSVLAPCSILNGEGDLPRQPAMITMQVDAEETAAVRGNEDTIENLLKAGDIGQLFTDSAGVNVIETVRADGAVAAYYLDPNGQPVEGFSPSVWRVFADVSGRLVTLSLRTYQDAPISIDSGKSLLFETLAILRNASEAS